MIPPISSIYVNKADKAKFSTNAGSATYTSVAGYVPISGSQTINGINLVGGGTTGSLGANQTLNISSSTIVDVIPTNKGNSVKWFVFLEDGVNSRANKVIGSWNNTSSSFYATEINSIGYVPVDLTVQHVPEGISLIATPESGSWSVRLIRILV